MQHLGEDHLMDVVECRMNIHPHVGPKWPSSMVWMLQRKCPKRNDLCPLVWDQNDPVHAEEMDQPTRYSFVSPSPELNSRLHHFRML